ncbi:MAG TPA: preprotein translocase subunit SecA [Flavobacteriaceae bacterium]|nr:preprotein translocase subunit SecA [Flavobacteriaceae bacterium]
MISKVLKKIFGSSNDRLLKTYQKTILLINQLEDELVTLSDEELKHKTVDFKQRLDSGEVLDDILPYAFAVVREASKRVLQMRHFDAQLLGGIALHQGKISEMRTGEGKTLVATLPAYLNALSGSSVHVITVNDYLAKRDANWMGKVFEFLGMTVGVNLSGQDHEQKQSAYAADITYGTNNEFGFDYLRDNMVFQKSDKVQRDLSFAIVDEVDSILIDEARTPLIISGQADDNTELYLKINAVASKLKKGEQKSEQENEEEEEDGDFTVDEKSNQVVLTERGYENAEQFLLSAGLLANEGSLYDPTNISLIHHVYAALRAHNLFFKDQHYVIQNQEIVIVDEFTGRMMAGRRWSDGLHQAVEAKEGVKIQKENQTLASITFQNYFRMYDKLAGMTGTADTEAFEFQQIYSLETVIVPTHRPMVRKDLQDQIFRTVEEKFEAIVADIQESHAQGQPILVGTTSIENSELLSAALQKAGLDHQVLNAKQHEREAQIVAQAGRPGVVTIATNMAGRGTDIKLSQEVKEAGGLAIIGTERHDSRRVDRQLRGRSGRQGDPGSSQFYVSLEDNLMRLFGSERVAKVMDRMGLEDGEVIQHSMMTKSIERAQKKVEENNFGIRKRLLEYDDVMSAQREVIYKRRKHALEGTRLKLDVLNMLFDTCEEIVTNNKGANDYKNFEFEIISNFSMTAPLTADEFNGFSEIELTRKLYEALLHHYEEKQRLNALQAYPVIKEVYERPGNSFERIVVPFTDGVKSLNVVTNLKAAYETEGKNLINDFERNITLALIDEAWKVHLRKMDELKQSVQLAVHEQKDPLLIYKFEAFELFKSMLNKLNKEVLSFLIKGSLPNQNPSSIQEAKKPRSKQNLNISKDEVLNTEELAQRNRAVGAGASQTPRQVIETIIREQPKIGRNEKITIKNVSTGETKTVKYKQAELLIKQGSWVISS